MRAEPRSELNPLRLLPSVAHATWLFTSSLLITWSLVPFLSAAVSLSSALRSMLIKRSSWEVAPTRPTPPLHTANQSSETSSPHHRCSHLDPPRSESFSYKSAALVTSPVLISHIVPPAIYSIYSTQLCTMALISHLDVDKSAFKTSRNMPLIGT